MDERVVEDDGRAGSPSPSDMEGSGCPRWCWSVEGSSEAGPHCETAHAWTAGRRLGLVVEERRGGEGRYSTTNWSWERVREGGVWKACVALCFLSSAEAWEEHCPLRETWRGPEVASPMTAILHLSNSMGDK